MSKERKRRRSGFRETLDASALDVLPLPFPPEIDHLLEHFFRGDRTVRQERAFIREGKRNASSAGQVAVYLHYGQHCGQSFVVYSAKIMGGVPVSVVQDPSPACAMKKRS